MSRAANLKAKSRRTVTCDSGNVYTIRRLSPSETLTVFGKIPDFAGLATEETNEKRRERIVQTFEKDPKAVKEFLEGLEQTLTRALVDPRVGAGDDEIALFDIPQDDQMELFVAVLKLAADKKEIKETVGP